MPQASREDGNIPDIKQSRDGKKKKNTGGIPVLVYLTTKHPRTRSDSAGDKQTKGAL